MARDGGVRRRGLTRRQVLTGGARLAVAGAVGAHLWHGSDREPEPIRLYSETVALDGPESRILVPAGAASLLVPGSRVLRDASERNRLLDAEAQWLAEAAPWTRSVGATHGTGNLAEQALLDIRTLILPNGAALAGWSSNWRYAWPRDGSHVAAALAAAGHPGDALRVLMFLQSVQGKDGWFEARYRPDGSGPPDNRQRQLDGAGWVLWACGQMVGHRDAADERRDLESLSQLTGRSLALVLASIDVPGSLPPPSPDYWEVRETVLTLGVAAPLLAGLHGAVAVYRALGDARNLDAAQRGAERLAAAIHEGFGRDGYPRHLGGDDRDTSLAFLLAPYVPDSPAEVLRAFDMAREEMRRRAGGVAPGAGWKRDGISWTPETAIFAMAAAGTNRQTYGRRTLDWLAAHRTEAGSLPEKVLRDGSPAAVAPLAWTAANVVLALDALRE